MTSHPLHYYLLRHNDNQHHSTLFIQCETFLAVLQAGSLSLLMQCPYDSAALVNSDCSNNSVAKALQNAEYFMRGLNSRVSACAAPSHGRFVIKACPQRAYNRCLKGAGEVGIGTINVRITCSFKQLGPKPICNINRRVVHGNVRHDNY